MNGVPIKYKVASEVKDYRWLARPRSTVLSGETKLQTAFFTSISVIGSLIKNVQGHPKPEVRGQRSEVRGQRSEVRGQRSEVRGQRSEVRDQIIGRISIDERPAVVDAKVRLDDWEVDTVIGKNHQGVLVTLAESVRKRR
jgi:hypothetical protein